jgi:aminoglycoside 6'-N-acetyltransferase I
MAAVKVHETQAGDGPELAIMMAALWPDGSMLQHETEAAAMIRTRMNGTLPGTFFVAEALDRKLIGFIQVGLRSHADGCDMDTPVGFVEGWFVEEQWRGAGIGRILMMAAEEGARVRQCREMASDALLDNQPSLRAHSALGFEVVERCVHFRKNPTNP